MRPSGLKTIGELTPGVEYIVYEDEDYVDHISKQNREYSKNMIGKIIDYENPQKKKIYALFGYI
jgi:hypothetical protein